jgi:hypothetical protein
MPITDFSARAASSSGPALALRPITPRDDADLPDGPARSLYVGVQGSVAVIDAGGGEAVILSGSCQYHPILVRRVLATGTTATGLLAIY